MKDRLPSKRW